MARTWTLIDIFANYRPNVNGWLCQPDTFDIVYFINSDHDAVLSWGGVGTEADISGSTFTTDFEMHGLVWFNSDLYVSGDYWTGAVWETKLYKYSGAGQVWAEVWDGSYTDGQAYIFVGAVSYTNKRILDCDREYIYISTSVRLDAGGNEGRLGVSSLGTSFVKATISGSSDDATYPLGIAFGSGYSRLIADTFPGDDIGVRNNGNGNFTKISTPADSNYLASLGYGDEKTFARWNAAGFPIYYDSNWFSVTEATTGVDTSGESNSTVQTLGDDAIMYCLRTNLNAYVWNPSTLQFDADGSIPDATRNVVGFFRFGSTLYALCGVGTTGYAYSGGAISNPFNPFASVSSYGSFYHGQGPGEGVLAEKFTLPFEAVNPGAMTLDQSLGTVVIGTKTGGADAAVYSSHPYPTGTSFSEGHPTGTSVTSMKWI